MHRAQAVHPHPPGRALTLVPPEPPAPAAPPSRPPRRRWPWMLATAAALALAGYAWWRDATAEMRALRALPPADRAALYRRTYDTLKNVCDPAPPRSLRDFCREQAELLIQLPECDDACEEIARRHRSQPAR